MKSYLIWIRHTQIIHNTPHPSNEFICIKKVTGAKALYRYTYYFQDKILSDPCQYLGPTSGFYPGESVDNYIVSDLEGVPVNYDKIVERYRKKGHWNSGRNYHSKKATKFRPTCSRINERRQALQNRELQEYRLNYGAKVKDIRTKRLGCNFERGGSWVKSGRSWKGQTKRKHQYRGVNI